MLNDKEEEEIIYTIIAGILVFVLPILLMLILGVLCW